MQTIGKRLAESMEVNLNIFFILRLTLLYSTPSINAAFRMPRMRRPMLVARGFKSTAFARWLVLTTLTQGTKKTEEISAGYLIRRSAVDFGVSLITNVKCASLLVESLVRRAAKPAGPYIPVCIEEYYGPGKTATA